MTEKLPAGMVRTGVFATEEEICEVFRPRRVMAITDPKGGPPIPFNEPIEYLVHRYALAHGLPEKGFNYGMTAQGEFVAFE